MCGRETIQPAPRNVTTVGRRTDISNRSNVILLTFLQLESVPAQTSWRQVPGRLRENNNVDSIQRWGNGLNEKL
jgi:hypothetical protein